MGCAGPSTGKPVEEDGWACPFTVDTVGKDVAGGGGILEFASNCAVLYSVEVEVVQQEKGEEEVYVQLDLLENLAAEDLLEEGDLLHKVHLAFELGSGELMDCKEDVVNGLVEEMEGLVDH